MTAQDRTSDDPIVPNDWLIEAGVMAFRPGTAAYRAGANEHPGLPPPTEVPLQDIRPPRRNPGVPGLVRERAIAILRAIGSDAPLPPVVVYPKPDEPYAYRLGQGFHRFHLSRALGFTAIPAAVLDDWEPWMTGDPMDGDCP